MTMRDQEQLDVLGLHSCRFDVPDERVVGATAAGIDQGRVTVEAEKIDRRIFRRRQLRPANLKNLVGDPHCAPCPHFSMLS